MKMEMCRVCLTTEKQLLPLDETFIINYNLLTNLNITLLDGMPQYSCQTCLDTVKCFIEFREKSITAETTLRDIIYCAKDVKTENKTQDVKENQEPTVYGNDKMLTIKSEIKEENYDTLLDNFDVSYSDYDEDINNVIVKKDEEDVKPERIKRRKHKINKVKSSKLIENLTNGLEDKWFCGICPETFEEKSDLNNHLNSHEPDRQCDLCRDQVNSLSQLLAHRLMHVPLKQAKCHICERKFKSCIYLEYHYRNMHNKGDNRYLSCNYCSVTCTTPKKFTSHQLQVHSGEKYFCDVCSKGFPCKSNLRSHMRFHNINKAYVCDMCEFSCKYSGGLKDHKIRRHNPQRVYCKQCKRPFPNQLVHDNHKCKRKLHICPICGLQLNGNNRLSRHMMVHSDIHKYECNRCPAKYKSRAALIVHQDRHDGNRTKQCEFCPAKFYSATVLLKHRRTHTGEKPYVCKVCNKGFTGNHNLKVHMKVHGEYLIVKKNSEQENLTYVTK